MPIIPGSNFHFKGQKFLDNRQTVNSTLDLLQWSEPLPDGFEIYNKEDRKWYQYDWRYWNPEKAGHFKERNSITLPEGNGTDEYDIPIYQSSVAADLGKQNCVTIPDLEGTIGPDLTYQVQNQGSYADILFKALRALQTEVAKLRNSFIYGIESYNGRTTTLSSINTDLENIIEEEPLWAVDEDGLSLIEDCLENQHPDVSPKENFELIKDGTTDGYYYKFTNDTLYLFNESVVTATDNKIFLYLTVDSLKQIIKLVSGKQIRDIDLSSFTLLATPESNLYNILLIISRKMIIKDQEYGKNFLWISIADPVSDTILAEGYITDSGLQENIHELSNIYSLDSLVFNNVNVTKMRVYSKYQNFSKEIIPSKPTDETYKYKAASITVRSVTDDAELQAIKDQIKNNELVIVESTSRLWTKINNKLTALAGSSSNDNPSGNPDDSMTQTELMTYLSDMGIVYTDEEGLQINNLNLGDVTFIHQATGKKFKFFTDKNGELISKEIFGDDKKLDSLTVSLADEDARGFIGQLFNGSGKTNDAGLNSDRLKIGAFYAPLTTDIVYGCSHSFVELENTSDKDICLTGMYLHLTKPDSNNTQQVYHLALDGIIPAGGTYLIRGKQHADFDEPNTFIKVKTYDQEWYDGNELISFELDPNKVYYKSATEVSDLGQGFALTWGEENLSATTSCFRANNGTDIKTFKDTVAYPTLQKKFFIDGWYYGNKVKDASGTGYWANSYINITSNTMYRNTFMLDPAKQAFQSFTTKDSSRTRWANANDIQVVQLGRQYIEFPHTNKKMDVAMYTPKASFEHKNVSTDKTKLDLQKPNMVTCSFGIDIYNTRCFNWISAGYFDEFVFIKNTDGSWTKYESYKKDQETFATNVVEFDVNLINSIYARMSARFPGDNTFYTAHKLILTNFYKENLESPLTYTYVVGREDKNGNPDPEHSSEEMQFIIYPSDYKPRIYHTTDQQGFTWIEYQVWAAAAEKLNEIIKEDTSNNNIIPILINTGDMTQNGTRINEWLDYYNGGKVLFNHLEQMNVIGNNDLCNYDPFILGTGDDPGKSTGYYFHIFYCYEINPKLFIPVVNEKYIPSLYYFDTRDYRIIMVNSEITQTTCQKWYNLNYDVNGVSKVCNIYTGFTIDGINQVYQTDFVPIYNMLYTIMNDARERGYEMITACHEMPFTVITNACLNNSEKGKARSINEKGKLVGSHLNQISDMEVGSNGVTPKGIYWFSRLLEHFKIKLCLGGHKHTYAVTYPVREWYQYGDTSEIYTQKATSITATENNEELGIIKGKQYYVSVDGSILTVEVQTEANSEIVTKQQALEYDPFSTTIPNGADFVTTLVKTYAKDSLTDGPMIMKPTLENDDVQFFIDKVDRTKFPLLKRSLTQPEVSSGKFYPGSEQSSPDLTGGVIYLMCQATGYKLTSNKELPSANQKYSQLIPQTTIDGKTGADVAADAQKVPMFVTVDLGTTMDVTLSRLTNIMTAKGKFNQTTYMTGPITRQYIKLTPDAPEVSRDFGAWVNTKEILLSL